MGIDKIEKTKERKRKTYKEKEGLIIQKRCRRQKDAYKWNKER